MSHLSPSTFFSFRLPQRCGVAEGPMPCVIHGDFVPVIDCSLAMQNWSGRKRSAAKWFRDSIMQPSPYAGHRGNNMDMNLFTPLTLMSLCNWWCRSDIMQSLPAKLHPSCAFGNCLRISCTVVPRGEPGCSHEKLAYLLFYFKDFIDRNSGGTDCKW